MNPAFFSKNVVRWYQSNKRDLPWRRSTDPYKIWLSEIMLQQTRVSQAEPYYKEVVRKYPTIFRLAAAKEQEILRLWQGLGYYSRARNMLKCAQKVVKDYKGKFPHNVLELKKLSGIGDYTAAAIASIAFHERVAVVDGNVYRVLARVFGRTEDIALPSGRKFFQELANAVIANADPGTYNQAIMEFGALQCTPKAPDCSGCPMRSGCVACAQSMVEQLPVKSRKPVVRNRFIYYLLLRHNEKLIVRKRQHDDIWKGLVDFPSLESKVKLKKSEVPDRLASHFKLRKINPSKAVVSEEYKHALTHQLLHVRFVEVAVSKSLAEICRGIKGSQVVGIRQLENLPKPALIVRYLGKRSLS